MANGERVRPHAFESACARNKIDHRTTKPKHLWTNELVERMNRTLKEATVKRLKTLKGLTPYEYVCKIWTTEPQGFVKNPHHQEPGLNI